MGTGAPPMNAAALIVAVYCIAALAIFVVDRRHPRP
jgi:hypothetical protein